MFVEYQDMYNVFFKVIPILMIYPIYQLRLPSSIGTNIGTLFGIYTLDYCPIGWHYILGFSYWVSYWSNKHSFIMQDRYLTEIIKQNQDK